MIQININAPISKELIEGYNDVEIAESINADITRNGAPFCKACIDNDTHTATVYGVKDISMSDREKISISLKNQGLYDYDIIISSDDFFFINNHTNILDNTTLAGKKQLKTKELKIEFEKAAFRPSIDTGLGFNIDGGRNDKDNIISYINYLKLNGETSGAIMGADNTLHTLSTSDIETIPRVIEAYGLHLYQLKWSKAVQIQAAQTEEELDAVSLEFI